MLIQTVLGDTFCCNSIQIISTRSLRNDSYSRKYIGEYKLEKSNSSFVVYKNTAKNHKFLVHGSPKTSNYKINGWRVNSYYIDIV